MQRLLILEGGTKKRASPGPAQDVYASRLWTARRRHAETLGVPWLILSAEHGLLGPEDPLEPYELRLNDLRDRDHDALVARVTEQLRARGRLAGVVVEAHVRDAFGGRLVAPLRTLGARVERPLAGLSVCAQLSWYRDEPRSSTRSCPLADAVP